MNREVSESRRKPFFSLWPRLMSQGAKVAGHSRYFTFTLRVRVLRVKMIRADNVRGLADKHLLSWDLGARGQDFARACEDIEADVDRVFMDGRSRVNSAQGVASMRRILRANALRNPAVGYCQGLNFIVGLLLQVELRAG